MKLLYVTQFYTPETIAASFRASEHAALWKKAGVDVTVFTGYPNYPQGRIFDGYTPKLLTEETVDGIRVLRSKLYAVPNPGFLGRLKNAFSFLFFGMVNMLFQGRRVGKGYDLVLGTSGIVFAALLGWMYAACHRIPFIFELRDITYQQLCATGKSPRSPSVRLMRALELFLCRRAKEVVVVTNGFRSQLIADGIEAEKLHVITNGVDIPQNRPDTAAPSCFTLSYFGTLGLSQNIPATFPLADAFHQVLPESRYLLIGEGTQREQINRQLEDRDHSYIQLLPGMDAAELESYYALTELSIVTLSKSENFRHTIPSKLFQIMGRGIAVLFIGPEGEAAQIVRDNRAGIALTGTYEEDLETLRAFLSRPDWRQQLGTMGKNGADAVATGYTRSSCAARYMTLFRQLEKSHVKTK